MDTFPIAMEQIVMMEIPLKFVLPVQEHQVSGLSAKLDLHPPIYVLPGA